MKKITIQRVKASEFYGMDFDVEFCPGRNEIRGGSGAGKTALLSAALWCLTGRDVRGRWNCDLFGQSAKYSEERSGTASVEVSLSIDGETVDFKRTALQKWTRSGKFKCHIRARDEYRYAVDGKELAEQGFKDAVSEHICEPKYLPLAAIQGYWRGMDKERLRKCLYELSGGAIDESEYSGDYSEVFELVRRMGLADTRKHIKRKMSKTQRKLRQYEIEESRIFADYGDRLDTDFAETELGELRSDLEAAEERIGEALSRHNEEMERYREAVRKVDDIKKSIAEAASEYDAKWAERLNELRGKYFAATDTNYDNETTRIFLRGLIESEKAKIPQMEQSRDYYAQKHKSVAKRTFSGVCPECGSRLMGMARKNAIGRFNAEKNNELAKIKAEYDNAVKGIGEIESAIGAYNRRIDALVDADEQAALEEYTRAQDMAKPFGETSMHADMAADLAAAEAEVPKMPWMDDVRELMEAKGRASLEMGVIDEKYNKEYRVVRAKARLRQIAEERGDLLKSESRWARLAESLWEYERETAMLLGRRAQAMFPLRTSVELSGIDKNGDVDFSVCQVSINGKNARSASRSEMRDADIDISSSVCMACDIDFPLLLDDADGYAVEDTDRQTIITKVGEGGLRVDRKNREP